ncbi:hypothetical protein SAMN04488026_104920 [Aliiruegeria lutimaris]|uniref:Uncharacterized protein n=1 Tax=Aliiruegeria lutimaris TaxID=571298 RepID=A0A1G9DUG4_9RHOB|nr:hypothetical protein SAMN04488026_104920 [Aliiruegeria lutimaris]
MVSHGFCKKGEIADICIRHLDVAEAMTNRERAERVEAEENLDIPDTALRNSVVSKLVQALCNAKRKGCAPGRRATPSRCASLSVSPPRPADR